MVRSPQRGRLEPCGRERGHILRDALARSWRMRVLHLFSQKPNPSRALRGGWIAA